MNDFKQLTQKYSGAVIQKIEKGESSGSVSVRLSDGRRIRLVPEITSGDVYREASQAIKVESL